MPKLRYRELARQEKQREKRERRQLRQRAKKRVAATLAGRGPFWKDPSFLHGDRTLALSHLSKSENADVLGLSRLSSQIPTLRCHYKVPLTETDVATSS
jgi:hypothetical protein